MLRFGILGAGKIAAVMAHTVNGMMAAGNRELELYAVASRDAARAERFAGEHGVSRSFGSYEAMLADTALDLVYVATPHSHHAAHIRLCLEAGKHVLCEKAFTVNEAQAAELFELAKAKGLLLTEAIWTRYMPSRRLIDGLLAEGLIGKPCMLSANLCYPIIQNERIRKPELAGGALLDVGVYTLNFAFMHFGAPERIESSVQLSEEGVDLKENMTLHYADGRMAMLHAGVECMSDRRGIIYGEQGFLEVENINNPQRIRVYNAKRELIRDCEVPAQISGYEYEVLACMEAIAAHETECRAMPHADTLEIMRAMDGLRADWGLRYPFE